MRRVSVCVNVGIVFLLGLLAPVSASAQGDRASIVGIVQDSSGAVLPGVSVEASSPALISGSRSVVTDSAGRYAVVDLRPGLYAVTFTLPGFSTVRREGIVLEGAFSATVNASMAVGAVEETVTVTGASPVVDIQNSRTQLVVNQDVLQALPVMRSIQDQANLVPGVVSRSTSRGQILSDFYINSMAARGSTDQRIYFDGMGGGNMLLGGGTQAIAGGVNELGQAEMVYDVGSQSAESAVSGVRMDAIPKDGGNQFSGTWRAFGSSKNLQNSNLNDELRAQGITAVNQLDFNWDNNVAVGGPIRQNKAWYFAAFELSQFNILVANVFFPDGSQADTGGHVKPNLTTRLTFQVSEKDSLSFCVLQLDEPDRSLRLQRDDDAGGGAAGQFAAQLLWRAQVDAHGDQPSAARSGPVDAGVDLPLGVPAGGRNLRGRQDQQLDWHHEQRLGDCTGRELQQQLEHGGQRLVCHRLARHQDRAQPGHRLRSDACRATRRHRASDVPQQRTGHPHGELGDHPQLAGDRARGAPP